MKKLLLFDINYTEGVNREPLVLKIKYWQKANLKITIFTGLEGKNYYQAQLKDVSYLTVPFRYHIKSPFNLPLEYLRVNLLALPFFLRLKGKFDLLYSLSTLDFLVLPWFLKIIDRKIRWFAMVDNLVPPPQQRPGKFILNLIAYLAFSIGNLLLKRTNGIFVVTDSLRKYYESKGIRVIKTGNGYGVDPQIFKGEIFSGTPKLDVLYCGRLHVAKGVFDLLEVLKKVVAKNKTFTLGIMGDGEVALKKRLIEKIKEDNLQKNVFMLGYKEGREKGSVYRQSSLFLFLSYDENCPQVVLEALAANKQIIAYNLPAYHDVFAKYLNNGEIVLFETGDLEGVADYLLSVKDKKIIYKNNPEKFSWKKIVKKEIETFYE